MTRPRAREDLLMLGDFSYERLRDRVQGLTDDEYFWAPVANCWTVRRAADGRFRADNDARPKRFAEGEQPPFTTIAWRLAHVVDLLADDRNATWLGLEPPAEQAVSSGDAAATANDGRARLDDAYARFRASLATIDEDALWVEMGPIAGPFGDSTRVAFVLHELDELIHHGAEVALLRDLYRASGRSPSL